MNIFQYIYLYILTVQHFYFYYLPNRINIHLKRNYNENKTVRRQTQSNKF